MAQKIKSNLISKALWVLKNRPMQFLSNLRSYWLFSRTRFLWKILGPSEKQVSLGKNVRIERFRCLLADGTSTHIEVGDHSVIYEKAKVQAFGNGHISIGSCCVLSDVRIYSRAQVRIGHRALISWNAFIQDFDPHPTEPALRAIQVENAAHHLEPHWGKKRIQTLDWDFPSAPIEIGDDVWIGANVILLKGCKIGSGSIVAAGSVVTGGSEFPEYSLIGGNPARLLKTLQKPGENEKNSK
jgi:acetyltransferase-like isoleucine patch superfamily enzyme